MTARGCARLTLLLGLAAATGMGCRPPSTAPGAEAAAAPRSGVCFTEVSRELGLSFRWKTTHSSPLNILEISSAGAGFIDYDQDGWPDILLVGPERCALFHNEQGRRFRDVTAEVGLDRLVGRWHGCAVGDVDNDGWPDLLITGYQRQALLRNEHGRRFTEVTEQSGIHSPSWGTSASFFDADGDGRLDLLLGSYVHFGPGAPEFMSRGGVPITLGPDAYAAEKLRYFHNLGGFRFREETRQAGFHVTRGKTFGTAVSDFNGDGHPDVYVANDEMPGNLFVNDGRGHFTDRGTESGTALSGSGRRQGGMGAAWGDYNNDLRTDLVVTTFTQEPKCLYRNDGLGLFTECSYPAQLTQNILPLVGFGVAFLDANRDGYLDLAMANGHVEDLIHQVDASSDYPQPLKLFLNRGGQTFVDASLTAGDGFRRSIVGRALAVADFNNDGAPDLLAADLEGAPVLLRNDSPPGPHWLGLDLRGGRQSNRMAIGARVVLTTDSGSQLREVHTDGSYLSAHDPRVLFGLGSAAEIREVRLRWPSGRLQVLRGLQVDRYYTVQEGEAPTPQRFR